jgi:hypothetical protein
MVLLFAVGGRPSGPCRIVPRACTA